MQELMLINFSECQLVGGNLYKTICLMFMTSSTTYVFREILLRDTGLVAHTHTHMCLKLLTYHHNQSVNIIF